ncbi:YbfB/YjiJ family MFS transporter [Methylobacterium sp. JK268]
MTGSDRLARGGAETAPTGPVRATLAAFCASLVGIGLARFAYTPLLPALVAAGWFAPTSAAYLGAANLAGYLAGACLGRPATRFASTAAVLRVAMLLATVAFFACATPLSFGWYFAWRFLSGLSGGALMVLAAPLVLPHVPAARRGLAGGAIFMGVGAGIAAAGTLVPPLLRIGPAQTWIALGVAAAVLTLWAWNGWPPDAPPWRQAPSRDRSAAAGVRHLALTYGLNAVGLVPHMLFLVDYVARGRGEGLQAGSGYWVLFGVGAMAGPLLAGLLADRVGFAAALRLALLLQVGAVAAPALDPGPGGLILSSLIVGAFTPGIVPLVLGRIHDLLPQDLAARQAAWSRATVSFALFQAAAAYGFSFLFAQSGGRYGLLFAAGAGALLLALGVDLLAGFFARRPGLHPAASRENDAAGTRPAARRNRP